MTNGLRFTGGGVVGIAVGVLVWGSVASLHPIFSQLALSGLVCWFLAGLASGAVSGAFAPHHKIAFAFSVGLAIGAILLAFFIRDGWSHGNRDPILWYGPVALVPIGHAVGGYLARGVWRVV